MLSRLIVKNFKSIGEPGVDLELKPLTILVGPNGSGKSSIFEAVAFAAQRLGSGEMFESQGIGNIHCGDENDVLKVEIYFEKSPELGRGYHFSSKRGNEEWWQRGGKAISPDDQLESVLGDLWRKEVSNTFLLSSTRGAVPRQAPPTASPSWVGKVGQDLIPLLAIIFGKREHEHIAQKIDKWVPKFGVAELNAGYWGGGTLGSDYKDSQLQTVLGLAVSSAGARQVLSIITQLFWGPKRSITIIEEPEISLHPESQLHLIDLFAEIIKDDKQILVTTHSPILVMALNRGVQGGQLKPGDVAVYHVEKKEKTGTTAKSLPIDSKGYIEGWIPSFAKVERELLREWVAALPEA